MIVLKMIQSSFHFLITRNFNSLQPAINFRRVESDEMRGSSKLFKFYEREMFLRLIFPRNYKIPFNPAPYDSSYKSTHLC